MLRVGVFLCCLLACLLQGCRNSSPSVVREIAGLKSRTTAPGGYLTHSSTPITQGYELRATWQINTGLSPTGYFAWIRRRLDGYRVDAEGTNWLMFVRRLEGDTYTLRISSDGGVALLNFTARPD